MKDGNQPNLLIVGNFPSDTGYAWGTIGEYFVALGDLFHSLGAKAVLCYPRVGRIHSFIADSTLEVEEFDFFGESLLRVFLFLRRQGTRVLYVTDRPPLSARYVLARLAGVRRVVVHERTSGHRDEPSGPKKWLKKCVHRIPFLSVDLAIGVSDFVADRLTRVSCIPAERVTRVYNAVDVSRFVPGSDDALHRRFSIPEGDRVVFAHARANTYKGIQTLIEAAAILSSEDSLQGVHFVYCGDGPDLERFRTLVSQRGLSDRFLCPGRCEDIPRLIQGSTVVVVPSIWQEALGLSVVEGMAAGKPVIATRVGGIVEIIESGVDGFLVGPDNPPELARALRQLLGDEGLRDRVGKRARATAVESWSIDERKKTLQDVFRERVLGALEAGS